MRLAPVLTFLLLGVLWPSVSVGQRTAFFIQGEVLDEQGLPLTGATVQLQRTGLGTTSGFQGKFLIPVTRLPDSLRVRFIGRNVYTRFISPVDFLDSDTLQLSLTLPEITEVLNDVTVYSGKKFAFYAPAGVVIRDYVVNQNGVFILRKQDNLVELSRLDEDGRLLASVSVLPRVSGLHSDCAGSIYVIYDDSLRLVEISHDSLILSDRIIASHFEERILPCVGANEHNLYFAFGTEFNRVYCQTDFKSEQTQILYQMDNYEELDSRLEYLADAERARMEGDYKKAYEMQMWVSQVLSKMHYDDFLVTDSGAVVVDYSVDSAYFFDLEGYFLKRIVPGFSAESRFDISVIRDEAQDIHYAVFEDKGITSLSRLDEGLRKVDQLLLDELRFPQKLRAWNSYLYFLYRDEDDVNRFKLYRIRLGVTE